jgi:hypothetical protein
MATEQASAPHAHPSTDEHDDTVEAHYACLERPPPAWTAGCSLAALSSPSTTLMARSSSTFACRAAAARIAHADLRREWGSPNRPSPVPSALLSLLRFPLTVQPLLCEVHLQLAEMLRKTTNMSRKRCPDLQNSFRIHRPLVIRRA